MNGRKDKWIKLADRQIEVRCEPPLAKTAQLKEKTCTDFPKNKTNRRKNIDRWMN